MKPLSILITAILIFFAGMYAGFRIGQDYITTTNDHMEYQQIENELADLKARVNQLERMRVTIDVVDHTGLWMVSNATIQGE